MATGTVKVWRDDRGFGVFKTGHGQFALGSRPRVNCGYS
ncbi:hypothetical protein ACVWXO_002957 [Bradyrhizobium sp. LM2.7]